MLTLCRILVLVGLLTLATGVDAQGVRLDNGRDSLDSLKFEDGRFVHAKGVIREIHFGAKGNEINWSDLRLVRLVSGETINAEILEVDAKKIHLKSPWKENLEIPRAALRSIEPGNLGSLIYESKPDPTKPVTLTTTSANGLMILRLNNNFLGTGKIICGKEVYTLEWDQDSLLLKNRDNVLAQVKAEKQNFIVIDTRGKLEVIWFNQKPLTLPPAKFQKVEFSAGVVTYAQEFSAEVVKSKPSSDPKQDRLTFHTGDELYGQLVTTKDRQCQFRSTRLRTYGMHEFRELLFQSSERTEKSTKGEHVRIHLASWSREKDILTGVLTGYSSEKIQFTHAHLGELVLNPKQIDFIEVLFFGERIPLAPKMDEKFSLKDVNNKKIELEVNAFSPDTKTKWELWLNGARITQLDSYKTPRMQLIPIPASSIREDNTLELRPQYQEGIKPDPIIIESLNLRIQNNK